MHLVRSGREERVVERGRVGRVTGAPEDALVTASTRNTAGVCAARTMARPCSLLACFSAPAVGSHCVCGHFSLWNAHTLATRAPFILRFLARLSCLFFFPIPSLSWLILASNLQQGPIPLLRGTRPPRQAAPPVVVASSCMHQLSRLPRPPDPAPTPPSLQSPSPDRLSFAGVLLCFVRGVRRLAWSPSARRLQQAADAGRCPALRQRRAGAPAPRAARIVGTSPEMSRLYIGLACG